MRTNKYTKLITDLEGMGIKIVPSLKIDEKFAYELEMLKKSYVTKKYKVADWEKLLAMHTKHPEIIPALFNTENVPEEIYDKIINDITLSDKQCASIACCDKLTDKQADTLKSKRPPSFWKSLIYDSRIKLSEVFLFSCCNSTPIELKGMDYASFEKINTPLMDTLIPKILENKDHSFFPNEIPEKFLTAVANNENFSEKIRDKAFDMGYVPANVVKMTKHMSEELYKSLADCIFEIMPQTPLEKQRHNNALKQVRNMMLQGSLTECCQLDFVSRFQNQTFDIDNETYKTILQCSKSSYVINLACQYKMREYKEDIMQNKNLTEDVMENLMNFFTIEKGKEIFLKIYNNKKTSEETTMKYLCHNDININRTIALHSEMPDKVYETLMRKNEYSDEFTALCNIGDALLDINDEIERKAIRNHILFLICQKDSKDIKFDYFNHPCVTNNNVLHLSGWSKDNKLNRISNGSYKILKECFNKQKERYKNAKDMMENFENNFEIIHNKSILFNAFPNIFELNYNDKSAIKNTIFSFEDFIDVPPSEQDRMYKFINKETDVDVLLYMRRRILNSISDLYSSPKSCDDTIYFSIYKLADMYNELNKKVNEIIKFKKCEISAEER